MGLSGQLRPGTLPQVLRDIYVNRRSGLLHLTRELTVQSVQGDQLERRSVRFRLGHIVHAQSNVPEERLGAALVRRGLISAPDLDRATEIVTRDKKKLGNVLEEMGLVQRNSLEDALAFQVHDVLVKVFTWSTGAFEFEEEPPEASMGMGVVLKISTGDLVLDAAQSVKDPDVVKTALGDMDRTVKLSPDPLLRFQRLSLTPAQGYVLSRVDGTLSANDIVSVVPLPADDVQQSLFGLLCTGVLEYEKLAPAAPAPKRPAPPAAATATSRPAATATSRPVPVAPPPPPPPPPAAPREEPPPMAAPGANTANREEILEAFAGVRGRSHFDVLGITHEATPREVDHAYHRLARRFHPDAHHDPALADLRDKLVAVFIRLGEAHQTLRDPQKRVGYERMFPPRIPRPVVPPPLAPGSGPQSDAGGAQRAAEASAPATPALDVALWVRRAQGLINEGKFWDAIQLLEEALPHAAGKMRRVARLLLATAYSKNPKWLRQAETILVDVITDEPATIEAYYLLGMLYSKSLKPRAAALFDKVLEMQPDHERARVERELLGDQPPVADPVRRIAGKRTP